MSIEKPLDRGAHAPWALKRFGGSYLTVAVVCAEALFFPIAGLCLLAIQANAHLQPEQLTSTILWGIIALCVSCGALIILMVYLTSDARLRLDRWAQNKSLPGGKAELDAWNQVTSIWWRYGIGVMAVFFVAILGLNTAQSYSIGLTNEQLTYTFLGGLVAAITIVLTTTPVLEGLLRPTLDILRPENLDAEKGTLSTLGLEPKFQGIVLALITVCVLLLAPIGYQAVSQALNKTVDSGLLYQNLQINLIGSIAAIFVLGLLISFLLARQVFRPVREIMRIFGQVEKGNTKERTDIAAFTSFAEMSLLAASFNRMASQLELIQEGLEKRITDSNELLRASNEVGKIASTILNPDSLITEAVNLIANTFSYYFVAIFLVEDDRHAVLKDATGTAGEVLKESHHQVLISDNNMVGASIIKKEPQIALDVGEGAKIVYNPLLSFTRSELTLPLIVGERVIGSLDVQSTREADFSTDNIATLQGMANQVAIAIENARLFAQMDQTLEELRQANRQYVVSSWTDKLQGQKLEFSTNSVAPSNGDEPHEVVVGLNLRDQSIGQIRLQTDEEWTPEDQSWVESLATQVAISLENARLIEESQGSALRERLSASIVQKIWASTTSIDTILQTAVRELGLQLAECACWIAEQAGQRRAHASLRARAFKHDAVEDLDLKEAVAFCLE